MKFLSGGLLLVSRRDDLFGGNLHAVGDDEVKTRIVQHALPSSDVRTFEHRFVDASFLQRICATAVPVGDHAITYMCRAKKSRQAYDRLNAEGEQIETKRVPEQLKNKTFPI